MSITNFWSLLKRMSIELVMPSNYLILCCPLLLLPSTFPSIWVFSNESVLCIRCWSIVQGIFPSQELNDTCHNAGRVFTVWATREPLSYTYFGFFGWLFHFGLLFSFLTKSKFIVPIVSRKKKRILQINIETWPDY